MDAMEDKLGSILGNPEMMQKISAMAQSLSAAPEPQAPPPEPALPNIDPGLLQKLAGFAGQTGIDNNQRTLLHALNPYLSGERISKLERAMRAAKMANFATNLLGR